MSDWKATLFSWTGSISLYDPGHWWAGDDPFDFSPTIPFTGAWLPSDDSSVSSDPLHKDNCNKPLPSPNTFNLQGTALAYNPGYLVIDFRGSYLLDGEPTKDKRHTLVIKVDGGLTSKDGVGYRLCAARGNTKFGKFVSLGWITLIEDDKDNINARMTLVRRYVDDLDATQIHESDEDYLASKLLRLSTEVTAETFADDSIGAFIESKLPMANDDDIEYEGVDKVTFTRNPKRKGTKRKRVENVAA